jgi:Arginosuccinate synthase
MLTLLFFEVAGEKPNVNFIVIFQVRFELAFFALNPKLKVVAPWREWDITGREDAIEYAKKYDIPVPVTKKSIYSRDRNLWHLSHEVHIHLLYFLYSIFICYAYHFINFYFVYKVSAYCMHASTMRNIMHFAL